MGLCATSLPAECLYFVLSFIPSTYTFTPRLLSFPFSVPLLPSYLFLIHLSDFLCLIPQTLSTFASPTFPRLLSRLHLHRPHVKRLTSHSVITVWLHSNPALKGSSHPGGGPALCARLYLGCSLTGRLAPCLLSPPPGSLPLSFSLILIHSLLARCCSMSIEAELNASVSGPNGFFIKMHYGTCTEFVYSCVCG